MNAKLKKLCAGITKYGVGALQYSRLKEYGFTDDELDALVLGGILIKASDDCYSLDGIHNYGKYLNDPNAIECFNTCFIFASYYSDILLNLFLKSLYARDYESAKMYLDKAFLADPSVERVYDLNFYLLLLGIIYDIGDYSYVSELGRGDVWIPDNSKEYTTDVEKHNSIRIKVMDGSYNFALGEIEKLVYDRKGSGSNYNKKGFAPLHDLITRELLLGVVAAEKKSKRKIIRLIADENIEGLEDYLTEKSKKRPLGKVDQEVLLLVKWYRLIDASGEIPTKTGNGSYLDAHDAIKNLAFEDALNLCVDEFIRPQKKISDVPNPIFAMLYHICNLLAKISNNRLSNVTENNLTELKKLFYFVSEQYELAKEQGFVILEPKDDENINLIRVIAEGYEYLDSFCITDVDKKKRVVLRYYKPIKEKDSFNTMLEMADNFFKKKNYGACIPLYLNLAVRSQKNRSFIYTRLGLSYMYGNNIDKAIDYFMLARCLPELSEFKRDYTNMINQLKAGRTDIAPKSYVASVKEARWDGSEVGFIFGVSVKTLAKVQGFVEEGKDVLQACSSAGLLMKGRGGNQEKIIRILLVYACQCYITERGINQKNNQYTAGPFVRNGDTFCETIGEMIGVDKPQSRVAKMLRVIESEKYNLKITPISVVRARARKRVRPGRWPKNIV